MPKATTARAKAPARNLAPKGDALDGMDLESNAPAVDLDLDDLFPKLDTQEEFVNLLYWGREGSSKTTSACSAANLGQIVVINAEGGLKIKALQRQGINTDNIRVWPSDGEEITHLSLDALYRNLKAILAKSPGAIYAVVMDSASEITETMVSNVSNDRLSKVRKRGVTVDDYDAFDTDRNDYGVMAKHFRDIARKMRDLPCHFILTALERRDVDEDTGVTMYGPAVSPGLQKDLLGYVDLVIYAKAADEDGLPYRGLTKQQGKFRAKDRMGALPRVLVNPTFERVLAYDNGELVESDDPMQALLDTPEEPARPARGRKARLAKKTTEDTTEAPTTDTETEEDAA